jgi:hypothetical protein
LSILLPAAFTLAIPASTGFAQDKNAAKPTPADALNPTRFKWSTSPAGLQTELETRLQPRHFGSYTRYSRPVELNSNSWRQFFVFHDDELIAQGYTRTERLERPRVGTISDVVSYNNNHWAAKILAKEYGKPALKDVRTRREYSEELGDDSLRAKRSLQWDLRGERYRWEIKNGTIRYTVQYSMDGVAKHRLVNVNPGNWAHYFEFITAQAFRDAGIRRIQGFRQRARQWITASFSPSGELKLKKSDAPSSAKPRSARRTQWSTRDCRISGKKCTVTYYYYGGHLYQVDLDFSQTGAYPRRGRHSDLGEAFYKHFAAVDARLRGKLGNPQDAKIIKDMDNGREARKAGNLVNGQEGFWSVWYDAPTDTLVRHVITGKSRGTGYHINHKITFRFHSVARALAEHDAWKAETAKISSK